MTVPTITSFPAGPLARIGERELAYSLTFMARDDEDVHFEAKIRDAVLPVSLKFVEPEAKEQAGDWRLENGVLSMEFKGWSNPLGTAINDPAKLGDLKGEPIWLDMAHHKVGVKNIVHFFLLVGGSSVKL